jgi:hypothetical protein
MYKCGKHTIVEKEKARNLQSLVKVFLFSKHIYREISQVRLKISYDGPVGR